MDRPPSNNTTNFPPLLRRRKRMDLNNTTPTRRQAWVDVYDHETGGYKPFLKSDGETSGQTVGEAVDHAVEEPQEGAHDSSINAHGDASAWDDPCLWNDGNGEPSRPAVTPDGFRPYSEDNVELSQPKPRSFRSRLALREIEAGFLEREKSDSQRTQETDEESLLIGPVIYQSQEHEGYKLPSFQTQVDPGFLKSPTPSTIIDIPTSQQQSINPPDNTVASSWHYERDEIQGENWDAVRQPDLVYEWEWESVDSDKFFRLAQSTIDSINSWLEKLPEFDVNLLVLLETVEDPNSCDFDPEIGILLAPVDYPLTRRADEQSALCVTGGILNAFHRRQPVKPEQPDFVIYQSESSQTTNPREVRIDCHLRPAVEEDMDRVCMIYSLEVETSYKLLDKEQIGIDDFRYIYSYCRFHKLPFIVAIEGKYTAEVNSDKIIGFTLVDVAVRGLLGSPATHAAVCGKLTTIVHPNFRCNNVASAMLDIILNICSPRYGARLGYDFVNLSNDPVYMQPERNIRLWNSIDMEYAIPSKATKEAAELSRDYKWITTFMENYFQMKLVHHDVKFFNDDRFDCPWLDRLTFRHHCGLSESS